LAGNVADGERGSPMQVDTYLAGVFMVAFSTAASIVGLMVVRRLLHSHNLISSHDVSGSLLSVVGTTYAVILGLIVVDAMAKFQEARQTTEHESNALADVLLLSHQLPTGARAEIETRVQSYIDRVVEDEWPSMDRGTYSPEARRAAIDLFNAVSGFDPKTEKEHAIYESELAAICEFWNMRRNRIVIASHGLPTLEWVVLVFGGVLTVSFTYFFKLEQLKIQVIMTAMVAMIIALCLFLVLMFGYPFSGELTVSSDNFRVLEGIMAYQSGHSSLPVP
jgi:Protein of unknown function (DUF4239)